MQTCHVTEQLLLKKAMESPNAKKLAVDLESEWLLENETLFTWQKTERQSDQNGCSKSSIIVMEEWNNTSADLLTRASHSCMVLTKMKRFHQSYDSALFVHGWYMALLKSTPAQCQTRARASRMQTEKINLWTETFSWLWEKGFYEVLCFKLDSNRAHQTSVCLWDQERSLLSSLCGWFDSDYKVY